MPRFAATILGLTLVALSIGFNTVRYPVVWEMVGPARASETVQAAVASQPEESERPTPPLCPAKPIDVPSTPAMTDKATVDRPTSTEARPAGGGDAAAAQPETQRPLVPVMSVGSPGAMGNQAAGIRRLPPVEPANPLAANHDAAVSLDGSIPVYPSTGIE